MSSSLSGKTIERLKRMRGYHPKPMSYSVHLYPRALEKKFKAAKDPEFIEDKANLIPWTPAVVKGLVEQLEVRGFAESKKSKAGRVFRNKDWGAEALLTESGLYLSAGGDGTF